MRSLIALVNDNHLKEVLAFVYYGSIVNNRPKNGKLDYKQTVWIKIKPLILGALLFNKHFWYKMDKLIWIILRIITVKSF